MKEIATQKGFGWKEWLWSTGQNLIALPAHEVIFSLVACVRLARNLVLSLQKAGQPQPCNSPVPQDELSSSSARTLGAQFQVPGGLRKTLLSLKTVTMEQKDQLWTQDETNPGRSPK